VGLVLDPDFRTYWIHSGSPSARPTRSKPHATGARIYRPVLIWKRFSAWISNSIHVAKKNM
jgi:hypothetical protein